MSLNEMESKIRELRSLQRLIEEAEQEAEAIKDAIKAQLTAQGVDLSLIHISEPTRL